MGRRHEARAARRAGRTVRERLTYANVVATMALIVALGTGGAWAVGQITSKDIARNAVRSKHIKNGQVKTADLRTGAVTAPKIAADAVTGEAVKNGSLTLTDLGTFSGGYGWSGGSLAAHSCAASQSVGAGTLDGNELILASPVAPVAPEWGSSGQLIVAPTWGGSSLALRYCNVSATAVNPVPPQTIRVVAIDP